MPIRKTEEVLSARERYEKWFGQRAVAITVVMAVILGMAIFFALLVESNSAKREAFYQRQLEYANRYAIVLSGNNLAVLKKEPIAVAVLEGYVVNSVENYFVLDRNDFISRELKTIPVLPVENPSQFIEGLIKTLPKVKKLSRFFSPRNKDSAKGFYIYLKYLYGQAVAGMLPDTIKVSAIKVKSFETDGTRFDFSGDVHTVIYFVGIDGKLHKGVGTISFRLTGYFKANAGKVDVVNPYGMVVTGMQFSYVKIPSKL